jgi:hypothetical protein
MLGSAVAIGALSGLAAAALGRLIEAAPDGSSWVMMHADE